MPVGYWTKRGSPHTQKFLLAIFSISIGVTYFRKILFSPSVLPCIKIKEYNNQQ